MEKGKKLKPTHYDVLSRLAANPDSKQRRLPGGFWSDDQAVFEYQQGAWSTTVGVVKAMQASLLISAGARNEFVLTELGAAALQTGVYPSC